MPGEGGATMVESWRTFHAPLCGDCTHIKLHGMSGFVMRIKNKRDKIHAEQTTRAKDMIAVPLNVQLHVCGVKATPTHFARPHALSVVVQPLNHLLLVHVHGVTRCGIVTARGGAYKELMISHIGFSLFLCVSFQSASACRLISPSNLLCTALS